MTECIEDMSREEQVARGYATRDCGYCRQPIENGQVFAQYDLPYGVCHVLGCGDRIDQERELRRKIENLERAMVTLYAVVKETHYAVYMLHQESMRPKEAER